LGETCEGRLCGRKIERRVLKKRRGWVDCWYFACTELQYVFHSEWKPPTKIGSTSGVEQQEKSGGRREVLKREGGRGRGSEEIGREPISDS
jgi:hypothetical protein